jgi:type I restriction enzyme S subunit
MSKWPMVKLGSLMLEKGGSINPALFKDEMFELFSIPAYDKGLPEYVDGKDIGSSKQLLQPNDVLLSKIVPHIRRTWVVSENTSFRQIGSGEWIVFRSNKINPHYLRLFLRTDIFHSFFMGTVAGVGGSLMRARPSQIKDFPVPLPPIPEQQRIVEQLDQAQKLIDHRKEQLKLMDDLIQSTFYEMFGDPVKLKSAYPFKMMKELGISAAAGKSVSGEGRPAATNEYGVLKVSAVTKGVFNPSENKYVENLPDCKLLFPQCGDVLVTRANTRELVAACCIVPDDHNNIFLPDKIWKIDLNHKLINWYFKLIVNESFIRDEIIGKATGTSGSMLNISQDNYFQTKIPVPPLGLQTAFADRVQQIESLKSQMSASLVELEQNFRALMQESFGG